MGIAASQARNDSDKPSLQDMSAETVTTPSQPTTIQNIPLKPTPKSPYLGLRRGKSSTRFIRIEPAIKEDDPIRCELSEIPFTEKPRFRALSYGWGRPSTDFAITLNGISVRVRQNLWEALRYLRKYEPDELYWIDALCINQDDIIERSQQVSVMHRIYFKAQIVVVWLGSGYAKYKTLLPGVVQARYYKPQVELPENSLDANDERHRIALELYNDDYWSRLWIVQEIGLAHEIRVCYGNSASEWSEFIDLINLYSLGPDGPMKFQRMREGKGKGSHTLFSLMKRHKDALCENRKDKVYGLIGMSSDARGHLTIDYAKSMFQIWSEVMQFVFPEDVTIAESLFDTARFIKILLMGTDCANSSQIPRLHSIVEGGNSTSPVVQSPRSFGLDAAYLGRVTYVGPTPHDAVGDLDQLNEWERLLNETYEVEANDAHQESDALIWAVEKLDNQILAKKIFDYESTVHWSAYSNEWVDFWGRELEESTLVQVRKKSSHNLRGEAPCGQQRLFQMTHNGTKHSLTTPFKMGVASRNIRVVDSCYWLACPRLILTVRRKKKDIYHSDLQVVGMGILTDELTTELNTERTPREDFVRDRHKRENRKVYVDAATIFFLSAHM